MTVHDKWACAKYRGRVLSLTICRHELLQLILSGHAIEETGDIEVLVIVAGVTYDKTLVRQGLRLDQVFAVFGRVLVDVRVLVLGRPFPILETQFIRYPLLMPRLSRRALVVEEGTIDIYICTCRCISTYT